MHPVRLSTCAWLMLAASLHAAAQQSPGVVRTGLPLRAHTSALSTIQGNALTFTNAPLANGRVRLRDARSGRIIETTTSDKAGLFVFRPVEPGSYVVELVGNDQRILAASQILNADAGDAVSAVVKLPFRLEPLGGILGHTAASAVLVTATAAASGILAAQVAGQAVSPRR